MVKENILITAKQQSNNQYTVRPKKKKRSIPKNIFLRQILNGYIYINILNGNLHLAESGHKLETETEIHANGKK